MKVRYHQNPAHVSELAKAYFQFGLEVEDRNFGQLGINGLRNDHRVFYVIKDYECIAFMLFHTTDHNGIWISSSWVAPDYRRKGLYKKLWSALIGLAAREKRTTIESMISVRNKAMRAAAKRRGSHEDMVLSLYEVKNGR